MKMNRIFSVNAIIRLGESAAASMARKDTPPDGSAESLKQEDLALRTEQLRQSLEWSRSEAICNSI
jgi:hypothetical protein